MRVHLAALWLAEARREQPSDKKASSDQHLLLLQEAAALYKRAAELNPNDERTWLQFGLLERRREQLPSARDCFRRGIQAAPHNPYTYQVRTQMPAIPFLAAASVSTGYPLLYVLPKEVSPHCQSVHQVPMHQMTSSKPASHATCNPHTAASPGPCQPIAPDSEPLGEECLVLFRCCGRGCSCTL